MNAPIEKEIKKTMTTNDTTTNTSSTQEETALVSTRTAVDFEKKIAGLPFDAMLSAYEQTIFVLDDSGSMSERVGRSGRPTKGIVDETSRTEVLKKSFVKFLEHKFRKNPDSRVSVIKFGARSHVLIEDSADVDAAKDAIEQLTAGEGNTFLHYGLYDAFKIVKKTSKAWVPRVIVISDGECHNRDNVTKVFGLFIDKRVIVDVIFVQGSETASWGQSSPADFLKDMSRRTGGVFEAVTSASEFEEKFLQVATRLALPPAPPSAQ